MKQANIVSLLFAILVSANFSAYGACSQADVTGTWYTTGVSGDSYYGEMAEWDRCKIRVGSTGSIIASGSLCTYRDSYGKFNLSVGGGGLRVGAACNVYGSIQVCSSGVCITYIIEHGQLDRGKTVMSFVGYSRADPDVIFSQTAIKQ